MIHRFQRHPFGSCLIVSSVLVLFAAACSGPQTPDPTEIARLAAQAVKATLTAQPTQPTPPTVTPLPTATRPPTAMPTGEPTATSAHSATPTSPPPTTVATPTFTPQPSPTATSDAPLALVQSDTLNVRSGPGTGHSVVTAAKRADKLPVSGRNADGSWLEVTLPDGQSGWIAASLAQLNMPADQLAVARVIPTPPPAPTAAPAEVAKPTVGKRDLVVSFINPHYDCEQGELSYRGNDGNLYPIWGYRHFQIDMFIKNNGSEPVVPPWKVKRWIMTDGVTDSVSDLVWEWTGGSSLYAQPTIQPGQSAGWTFVGFPIERSQWIKAVEFVWNGQVYRQEFDLGQFGNAHNYKDCGEPRKHVERPTPTPQPASFVPQPAPPAPQPDPPEPKAQPPPR